MGEEEWKMKDSYHTDREVRFIKFFWLVQIIKLSNCNTIILIDGAQERYQDQHDDFLTQESTGRISQSSESVSSEYILIHSI
jgi:hypothetical protein